MRHVFGTSGRRWTTAMLAAALCSGGVAFGDASPKVIDAVNQTLNLVDSEVVTIGAVGGDAFTMEIQLNGEWVTLDLFKWSVRADNYQVLVQQPTGELVPVEPGPVNTYRGAVQEVPGSVVSASVDADGVYARIWINDIDQYWMEPIAGRVAGAQAGDHALYHNDDIISPEGACATVGDAKKIEATGGPASDGGLCVAELACDADFEYFQDYGSVAAVENRINAVVNGANVQYENQTGLTHVITAIIVRDSEPDPYTSFNSGTLLTQFRNEWFNNQGAIQRDVAHLFTGKDLNGGTIGQAWEIGSICSNSTSYCHAQSDCCGSFGCATDLTAHELGHLWNAVHCSCPGNTMNPFITCANNFSGGTINSIVAYAATRPCLDCDGGGGPCGPGAGPCDQPNGTPGCDDVECCELICGQDPFCCETEWDQICADAAIEQCGPPPGPCGPGAGPCDQPNGTPGCDDVDCCNLICGQDPFCCDVEWDQICADAAIEQCGGPKGPCGPGAGPCDQANGTPGCDDVDCCNLICGQDPFCCDTEWDQICANAAIEQCGGGGGCLDCQPGDLIENEACGADTNGGCNSTPPAFTNAACGDTWCGTGWADGGTRDTDWYLVTISGGTLSGTLTSEFPAVVFVVDGIGACAPVVVGTTGESANCSTGTASADLSAGDYVIFVAPQNFDGTPCGTANDYRVTITCESGPGDPCNPDAGPCDQPNGSPGCNDIACCELICGQDPFCCDVEWDQICADAAIEQCGGPQDPCNPDAGPCDQPNGTPGCNDIACCELICGQDPFCCDVEWDQICADAANEQCFGGPTGPPNDLCEDRISIGDGATAYSTIDAETDGVAHSVCQFDGQTYEDIWYNYTATCTGTLTVSTCNNADYDTDLVVYSGCNTCPPGDAELLGCNDDAEGCAGFTSEVSVDVVAGNCYKIRVGGWNPGDEGNGTLTITCEPTGCPCVWDLDGDCDVDPGDLATLLSQWGAPYGPGDLAALLAEWGCEG